MDVFADPALDANTFVLTGLGSILDPRATDRLLAAAASHDAFARMHAAIGLGQRRDAKAIAALADLLADQDYLVRFHALRGLAASGDDSALPALGAFAPPTDIERQLAEDAVGRIGARQGKP